MANSNRHMTSGQFTDAGGNNRATDLPRTHQARRHIQRLQNMNPTPQNIMQAHEEQQRNATIAIPSGPFWQQT